MKKFDYIIGGAGCAGLMLAYYMNRSSLKKKKILLIDLKKKSRNDRTFCFWENKKNDLEAIIFKKWNILNINNGVKITYPLKSYYYKMIRGIDLYKFIKQDISNSNNIVFINEKITDYLKTSDGIIVKTNNSLYHGKLFFNSIPQNKYEIINSNYNTLTQHFLGWYIETENKEFDTENATFMDFSVEQNSDLRFSYILPYTDKEALVEYTIFSKNILSASEYQNSLELYISKKLGIDNYKIKHKEFGKILMTDYPFNKVKIENVINIGVPGGLIKPSCGFGFLRMQNHAKYIVKCLENNKYPKFKNSIWNKRHRLYNSTFLNVLVNKKIFKKDVFSKLFSNNNIATIFKFLDEKTNIFEEIRFFLTVHKRIFFYAIIKELIKRMRFIRQRK